MFGWGGRRKNTVFLYFGVVLGLSRFVKLKVGSPTVDKAIFKIGFQKITKFALSSDCDGVWR